MGVVGLETSFAVMYTRLVRTGVLSLEELLVRMHDAPAARFGIGSAIEKGAPADLAVFDLNAAYTVDPEDFVSMGKSTPFAGETLFGKCRLTMVGGGVVWQENSTEK